MKDIKKLRQPSLGGNMTRRKKTLIEKQIEVVAKKLNIFTINDLEVLLEKTKLELIPYLEFLVSKNLLKYDNNSFHYIPPKSKSNKIEILDNKEDSLIHCLPFRPKKPKEIYLRNINEMDGFVDYFFATKATKDRIKKMFKVVKEAQDKKGDKMNEVLKRNKISFQCYQKYKNEFSKNGLINLLGNSTQEPGEIFYFYKEYFLSPQQLTSEEAWELAIQRFEKLIKLRLNRCKITRPSTMYKWMKQEYTDEQIEKFRIYNFSEFDTDKLFHD